MRRPTKTEQATEKIARRMCREIGQPEALWELMLGPAYDEHYGITRLPDGTATTGSRESEDSHE